jgi:hypothetical protein
MDTEYLRAPAFRASFDEHLVREEGVVKVVKTLRE